jgi:hypothetical protein
VGRTTAGSHPHLTYRRSARRVCLCVGGGRRRRRSTPTHSSTAAAKVDPVLPAAGDVLDTGRSIPELWIVSPASVQTLLDRRRPPNRWCHGLRHGRGIDTVREAPRRRSEEPVDPTGQVDDCCRQKNDARQDQCVLDQAVPALRIVSCVPHPHPERSPCPSQQPSNLNRTPRAGSRPNQRGGGTTAASGAEAARWKRATRLELATLSLGS